MKDLSLYRLNNYSELQTFLSENDNKTFHAYRELVYVRMNSLKPGHSFKIRSKVKEENFELFIKTVCLYILESADKCNIIFSDDYEIIIGVKTKV